MKCEDPMIRHAPTMCGCDHPSVTPRPYEIHSPVSPCYDHVTGVEICSGGAKSPKIFLRATGAVSRDTALAPGGNGILGLHRHAQLL